MSYSVVSVGTTVTLIVPANNSRRSLIIDNQGSEDVFLGPDTSITTSNTIKLRPRATLVRDGAWYGGAIYGIVASGTVSVGYWETKH